MKNGRENPITKIWIPDARAVLGAAFAMGYAVSSTKAKVLIGEWIDRLSGGTSYKELFYILLLAGPKLDARIVNDMGIRKYDRMEDIMADIDIKGKDVYIIPFGGSVMPQTEADYTRFSEEI